MGTATSPALVAAVSDAGGFGTQGTSGLSAAQITSDVKAIREATDRQPNRRTLASVCPSSMTITRFLCASSHTMMCTMSADDRHLPLNHRDCERLLWVAM